MNYWKGNINMFHLLSTEQLKKLVGTMNNGDVAPDITDDPKVNFAVDCLVSGDDEDPYDSVLYEAEVKSWKSFRFNRGVVFGKKEG